MRFLVTNLEDGDVQAVSQARQPQTDVAEKGVGEGVGLITKRVAASWDTVVRGGWQTLAYRAAQINVADRPRTDQGQMYGVGVGYPHSLTGAVSAAVEYYSQLGSNLEPQRGTVLGGLIAVAS